MKTVLTGIQSSGIPHLGNLLGAIIPAITMSKRDDYKGLFFIADYHALTTIKDKDTLQDNMYSVVAAWLAFGLDVEKHIFFKQSDVIEVMELTWVLNCFTPYPMLANAHSFKDKADNLKDVNAGLFVYPVLMASDILLYDVTHVPVGKDQKQHLEMARDIASKFNSHYNNDFFVIPKSVIAEDVMLVPGTDGRKMSKSYANTINIFLEEKALKKVINSIQTDSKGLEEPKDPDSCNVFHIYQLLADEASSLKMRERYVAGNYGYGHAKKELLDLILSRYEKERIRYNELIGDKEILKKVLRNGADRASKIAQAKIKELRHITGYNL